MLRSKQTVCRRIAGSERLSAGRSKSKVNLQQATTNAAAHCYIFTEGGNTASGTPEI